MFKDPGAESHGGYTFTSLAALTLLGGLNQIKQKETLTRYIYLYNL